MIDHAKLEADCKAFCEGWKQGAVYANMLAVGDVFRGSRGEADHRGLSGAQSDGFHGGAFEVIKKCQIWTDLHSNTIVRIVHPD